MFIPSVDNLRSENWRSLSIQHRLGTLQEMENSIAAQESRKPCLVQFVPEEAYQFPEDHYTLRGYHNDKQIFINEGIIQDNTPYLATETLFHEARHDYQEHVAEHPELAKDPQQFQDFQMNTSDGYLNSKISGYLSYRWQPIEKDANEVARQRTEELYVNEFNDQSLYPAHRQQMEKELAEDIDIGKIYMGDDYAEKAREKMIAQYQEKQTLNEKKGTANYIDASKEAQDTSRISSPDSMYNLNQEDIAELAGEITAGPVGAEVGNATSDAQSAVAESIDTTETPIMAVEEASQKPPVQEASEPDEQQYYGYGH